MTRGCCSRLVANPTEDITARSGPFYGWTIVIVVGLIAMLSQGASNYLFGVVLVPVSHQFAAGRASLSASFSVGLVVAAVAGYPIGRMVDRGWARWVAAAGCALLGISLVTLALAGAIWQVYLIWAVGLGLGGALTSQQVAYTVVTSWFDFRRGTALGLVAGIVALALPLFVPAAATLVSSIGWRSTMAIAGAAFLLTAFPAAMIWIRARPQDMGLLPDGRTTPASSKVTTEAPIEGFSLRQALRSAPFWSLTLSGAFASLGFAAVSAHQIPFLTGRGIDPVIAATAVGAVGLISIPGRILLNMGADRLGSRGLLVLSLLMQGAGILCLLAASSAVWLVLYVIVFGAAFGSASGLRAVFMAEHFGKKAYGAINSVSWMVSFLVGAGGPVAAGVLYDRLHSYVLAFIGAAGCYGLGALAALATPNTARSKSELATA